MTYPISEGTSGGFTGLTNNLGGVIFICAPAASSKIPLAVLMHDHVQI